MKSYLKKMRRYFALTKAGIMETMQYRMSLFVMVIGNLLYLTLIYFLWKAIFASSGTDEINGMTFETTMIYLVFASALCSFMEMYFVWTIGRNIQSGKIVLDLLRPMSYKSYLFWSESGGFVVNFFATFLPTFIVVKIITKATIPMGINLLYFIVAVILGVIINYNIDFLIGTVCLYTESIWGINIMKQVIVSLLSGATIPLAFFPEGLRKAVDLMPFRAIYDTPLTLLLDGNPSPDTVITKLGISVFWVVTMSVITFLFWKVSIKQVTVNGG